MLMLWFSLEEKSKRDQKFNVWLDNIKIRQKSEKRICGNRNNE